MDDEIVRAIKEKRLVSFQYHGYQRVAEPHIFGRNNGIKQILVFQVSGGSKSGKLPNWRRVDLPEITGFTVLQDTFPGKRPNPSGEHSVWDEKFIIVS